jgi:hypothetical protein
MRRLKQDPLEQLRRRKEIVKTHRTSKVEQLKRWRYKQRNHRTSKEGVKKRKNHIKFKNKDMWRLF